MPNDRMAPEASVFGLGATDLTRTSVGPKLRAATGVSGPAQQLGSPLEVINAEANGTHTRAAPGRGFSQLHVQL